MVKLSDLIPLLPDASFTQHDGVYDFWDDDKYVLDGDGPVDDPKRFEVVEIWSECDEDWGDPDDADWGSSCTTTAKTYIGVVRR